ncbi:MAG: DUF1153 domain-containing protein [Halomonas sp.]|uniref:DUF1153 domain-containing protein n=1 Tax=Halomonas sp. TaxID=1486246 RepID=UPI003970B186
MSDDSPIKRWTAKRKAAVVMDIFKGKITAAEVARQRDFTVSEVEECRSGGPGEAGPGAVPQLRLEVDPILWTT